ncbi:MAG: 2,5-diamino-6-(ribosylamino)-4(3H)-pyrimidinone 5'-phosphate reductase [Archaeoglobaceae archaeon]|nr:2,5-diamino-6-(ribosylamino)-4(3H)-pyrimidinone 5'-phosphate reductase [Archaeoglobaceae archaeon]MCX8151586.1 2,5-diamino-6-(ribosylamino)-4(3H)-pyrimidinone 5'-phosphate reductase [Archaeoglobaceae archaeon]MDW8013136.1 2,5-diamino-6-(ribosylamino)-4(3H)-pyrimidinone 5'-phosphate reductase [Archaeoglobaceae archaeon]
MQRSKPYVIVNMAASLDGKISDESRRQLRISCEEDLKRVDVLRADCDAIMVGIGTVFSDDPSLKVKSEALRMKRIASGKSENPIRIVVDSKCRIPLNAKVLDRSAKTIVAVSKAADRNKVDEVKKRGAEVLVFGEDLVDLEALMDHLAKIEIKKLLVEGGGTLVSSLVKLGLFDEINIYFAPLIVGGKDSPTICDGRSFLRKLEIISIEKIGEGFLVKAKPSTFL